MALNPQMQHEAAHVKLDRAMTQAYADMTDDLAGSPVGTSIDSTTIFRAEDHPDLIAGIGNCYDPDELGAVGVVMTKISDTEMTLVPTRGGNATSMTFEESRSSLAAMNEQMDAQLELFHLLAEHEPVG